MKRLIDSSRSSSRQLVETGRAYALPLGCNTGTRCVTFISPMPTGLILSAARAPRANASQLTRTAQARLKERGGKGYDRRPAGVPLQGGSDGCAVPLDPALLRSPARPA